MLLREALKRLAVFKGGPLRSFEVSAAQQNGVGFHHRQRHLCTYEAHQLALLPISPCSQEGSDALLEGARLDASHAVNGVGQQHNGVLLLKAGLQVLSLIDQRHPL